MNRWLMNTVEHRPQQMVRGNESSLTDENGYEFLDFFTDVGTASLGYGGEPTARALDILKQSGMGIHAPNLYNNVLRDRVSERLCLATNMDKVFWCNSGSEAVEAAIKLARLHHHRSKVWADSEPERYSIWSYRGGFHGRTYGALAAGDGPRYHYEGFHHMPAGFAHFLHIEEISGHAAAVILSPIFANGDVKMYPTPWLRDLRDYTQNNGILLIFDEVQTGSGRSGQWTYAQRIGVQPDIVTLAKGLGMGCPVGAMLAKTDVAAAFTPGTHFSTFGGNPIACAFVAAMLDWMEQGDNQRQIELKGNSVVILLGMMKHVTAARHSGMLIAFDTTVDRVKLEKAAADEGLLLPTFRPGPGTMKITPPLNITQGALEKGMSMLERALKVAGG